MQVIESEYGNTCSQCKGIKRCLLQLADYQGLCYECLEKALALLKKGVVEHGDSLTC